MFGIFNYVFIILGFLSILYSSIYYEYINPHFWGKYKSKYKLVNYIYKFNIVRSILGIGVGMVLIGIGLYGMLYDIHQENEKGFKEVSKELLHEELGL